MSKFFNKLALFIFVLLSFSLTISFYSCDDNDDDVVDSPINPIDTTDNSSDSFGNIIFTFDHKVDGVKLEKDVMKFTNAAGNQYEVNQVQYFLSNMTLHKNDGAKVVIKDRTSYYIDDDISTTLTWNPTDSIPPGLYNAISFTFGIDSANNTRYKFLNSPEKDMTWPSWGGENGGYHYMKLNGSWIDSATIRRNFGFHLGVGMKYDIDSNMVNFQNYFDVTFSNLSFEIVDSGSVEVQIVMNIENWFKNPNIYNHNDWGGAIMMKQDAQQVIKENGQDVFTIGYVK